jgi:hypothetical protein
VSSRDDAREKGVPRRYKECLSMFILLSDTCIKIQINTRLPREITSRYFLKVSAFLIPLRRGGVKTPPLFIHLRYTYTDHVPGTVA